MQSLSLLLLFLAFTTLLFLCKQSAVCLEPIPAPLNVPGSVVHSHLLFDLGLLLFFFDGSLFFALLALCSVGLDLLHDFCDLLACLSLLLFDLVAFVFDALNLGFALRFLLLILSLQECNALIQVTAHCIVNFCFCR